MFGKTMIFYIECNVSLCCFMVPELCKRLVKQQIVESLHIHVEQYISHLVRNDVYNT